MQSRFSSQNWHLPWFKVTRSDMMGYVYFSVLQFLLTLGPHKHLSLGQPHRTLFVIQSFLNKVFLLCFLYSQILLHNLNISSVWCCTKSLSFLLKHTDTIMYDSEHIKALYQLFRIKITISAESTNIVCINTLLTNKILPVMQNRL